MRLEAGDSTRQLDMVFEPGPVVEFLLSGERQLRVGERKLVSQAPTRAVGFSCGHAPDEYTNFDLLVARASLEGLVAISGEPSSAPRARFNHGASLSIDQPTAPFRA